MYAKHLAVHLVYYEIAKIVYALIHIIVEVHVRLLMQYD